jgi:hypothetical protein
LCVLGAEAVAGLSWQGLKTLASGFYNDAYLFDQNACSSPRLVIWLGSGEEVKKAQDLFWEAVGGQVRQRYELQPVNAVDKYAQLLEISLDCPWVKRVLRHGNWIYRLEITEIPSDLEQVAGKFGTFLEYAAESVDTVAKAVTERFQTLVYFGVEKDDLRGFVLRNRLTGIDRVVPIGAALDIGVIWDGYDLIRTLSRVINFK